MLTHHADKEIHPQSYTTVNNAANLAAIKGELADRGSLAPAVKVGVNTGAGHIPPGHIPRTFPLPFYMV